VIAARDEAGAIISCLKSVLADSEVKLVVVVDDHSRDTTLHLARNDEAATENRLLVLSAPDLPGGWVGKSHALHYGALNVETEFILFADADVSIIPGAITAARRKMDVEELDHLSGFFKIHCGTIGEQVCASVFLSTATTTLFGDASSRGSATGAFNMIRTTTYLAMGGHERFKQAVVDDVFLARTAKEHGARTTFLDLSGAVRVRLFEGLSGYFRVIARSTQAYLGNKVGLTLVGGAVVVAFGLFTALNIVASWSIVLANIPTVDAWQGTFAAVATLGYGLAMCCAWEIRRYHDGAFFWSLLFPIAVIVMGAATIYSGSKKVTGSSISWRGRNYEVN
jgi:glycosyltransferase involved in cell wall biosynthesis